MKNNYISFIPALITCLFLQSCETDVKNVNLPEFEQKLAIASFICPSDTLSSILVTSNQRIYGNLDTELRTGKLSGTISDGTAIEELDQSETGLTFSNTNMPVVYGKTYTLKVTSDKGLSAEATCIVPEKRVFQMSADTFSISLGYEWGPEERRIDVNFRLKDIAGEENFYRIHGKAFAYITNDRTGNTYRTTDWFRFEKSLFTDKGFDGKEIVRKSDYGFNYFYGYDSAFIVVYLYNTSKQYYMFHKSLSDYNDGDTPFSEVTPVFSNITGGLGIFAAYTKDSLVFRLK